MFASLRKTFFLGALMALAAFAQDRGTVTGTVTDGSGGSLPGATVTLRNPGNSISQNTTTDLQGSYTFLSRPADMR